MHNDRVLFIEGTLPPIVPWFRDPRHSDMHWLLESKQRDIRRTDRPRNGFSDVTPPRSDQQMASTPEVISVSS